MGAGKKARASTHNQVSQASFRESDKRKNLFLGALARSVVNDKAFVFTKQ
jgi:hypothetical protein